jgi:phosphatidate cytidylyltransferase
MKRVLTAVVLIPLVLLIVFKAPLWLFALVVAGIIVLALHEYLNIAVAAGIKPFHRLTYIAALIPILWLLAYLVLSESQTRRYHAYPQVGLLRGLMVTAFLLPILFGIALVFKRELRDGLASVSSSALGVLYIGVSLSLLIVVRADFAQRVLVLLILFSVWAGDIAAYYVGRTLGKHKLAPIVSPNKSWEGAIASVIASVAVSILILEYASVLNSWFSDQWGFHLGPVTFYTPFSGPVETPYLLLHAVLLGALTNISAQFGDLFESALKRGAGLKDSGTLLPGHGGMLDRIDALLFAIPVVWYYATLSGLLQEATFFRP